MKFSSTKAFGVSVEQRRNVTTSFHAKWTASQAMRRSSDEKVYLRTAGAAGTGGKGGRCLHTDEPDMVRGDAVKKMQIKTTEPVRAWAATSEDWMPFYVLYDKPQNCYKSARNTGSALCEG